MDERIWGHFLAILKCLLGMSTKMATYPASDSEHYEISIELILVNLMEYAMLR